MAEALFTTLPAITGGGSILVSSVFQSRVPNNGGHRLDITGVFPVGEPLYVYIGPLGTSDDYQCVAGKAGRAGKIYAITAAKLRCYTPRLPTGGPFHVTVQNADTEEEANLLNALFVNKADFKTHVFALRALFPPVLFVGPRKIEDVPPIG
jgi:hypothetical protein